MIYEETQITGVVEEVTFRNDANGFTVLDISVDNDYLTAVGVMPGVSAGESVTLDDGTGITPPSGKVFSKWALDAAGTQPVTSPYTPSEDVTLYAIYVNEA